VGARRDRGAARAPGHHEPGPARPARAHRPAGAQLLPRMSGRVRADGRHMQRWRRRPRAPLV